MQAAPAPPLVADLSPAPPADLLLCPTPPAGVPAGQAATLPAPVRAALMRLALAYRQVSDQLGRLIAWHDSGNPCPSPGQGAPRQLLPQAAR